VEQQGAKEAPPQPRQEQSEAGSGGGKMPAQPGRRDPRYPRTDP